jgi:predicted nucleotidyltransferase
MATKGDSPRTRVPETGDIAELADRFDLADVYVFGSRAPDFTPSDDSPRSSGTTDPEADLDIGVRSIRDHRLSARRRAELVVALEDLFEVPRVDLVIVPEAPPFLALAVISGELLYARNATDQAEYELYVLRRAGDLAPFERERRALVLGDG